MPDAPKKKSQLFEFVLIFAIVYLVSQYALKIFFPQQFGDKSAQTPIVLTAKNVTLGNNLTVTLQNNTEKPFTLPVRCPLPSLDVFGVADAGAPGEKLTPLSSAANTVACDAKATTVAPGKTAPIDLNPWKYSIFGEPGVYEIRVPGEMKKTEKTEKSQKNGIASGSSPSFSSSSSGSVTTRFTLSAPGFFTKLFRTFITKPFLNFLILAASILPGHNLGIAIIILTLLVKLLLFLPTQHAMEGQRKMQLMQPKIEALKEQYKGNNEMIQKETMRLWKEHGVNPVQSCLPMFIQFPILIGLFYVIRDGSNLALSKDLIYSFYTHLDWNFGTDFLWLDLGKPDPYYIISVLLVLLQFGQMKLSFVISERKKKASEKIIDVGSKKAEPKSASAQNTQQQVMLYGLPLMIGFFALQFPAAVSLYWGVSTIFAIGQQIVVNRRTS